MLGKTKTRIQETVKDSSRPLIDVLYMILAALGAIFLALVTRAH
jgi:hypothetical protein